MIFEAYIEDAWEATVNGPGTGVELTLACVYPQADTDGSRYADRQLFTVPLPQHSEEAYHRERLDLIGSTLRITITPGGTPPDVPAIPVVYGTATHDQYGNPRT